MPNIVTLSELIAAVRQRSDHENSTFVSDAELTGYINKSIQRLHDIRVGDFSDFYEVTNYDFDLSSNVKTYALPGNFYKLIGIDATLRNNFEYAVDLPAFPWGERNRHSYLPEQGYVQGDVADLMYKILGQYITFRPLPSSGKIRLWYITPGKKLTSEALTFPAADLNDTDDYIDVEDHRLNTGSPFTISSDGITPGNLTAGQTYYAIYVTDDRIKVANSVQNAIDHVAVDLESTLFNTGTISASRDKFDAGNGWDEFIILDATEKVKIKEDLPTNEIVRAKAEFLNHLESAAENKDSSDPPRIADVYGRYSGGFYT